LAGACQETVNLPALDLEQVVNLNWFVPAERQVKSLGRVGRRMHAFCIAAGKVLLAYLPSEGVERILATGLAPLSPRTITDGQELRRALSRVCQPVYAVAQEELEKGLNVVAASIYDHTGQPVASISVAGPAYRVTPERFPDLAVQVKAAAGEMSRRLEYRGG
jgi:DNA-binding IclR family transcriptional regulator